jgi:hypothetical protein
MCAVLRSLALVALVTLAACLGVSSAAATTSPEPDHGPAERPSVLLWGDHVFFSPRELEPWLARHHETYAAWAALHPIGRSILDAAGTELPRFEPWQLAPVGEAAVVPVPAGSGSGAGPLLLGLAAFAVALIILTALPTRRLAPRSAAFVVLHERRVGVPAVAIGILLGVAVARLVA